MIQKAIDLIKSFEGFYSKPYLCPAGIPTIGYGTIRYEDGRRVTLKDSPITKERAEQLLMYEVNKECIPAILEKNKDPQPSHDRPAC